LRRAGVYVTPFEPYRLGRDGKIDKAGSLAMAREFLTAVACGTRWISILISSVLNSVPFAEDRAHIACICAALCDEQTRLYACASSTKQNAWESTNGKAYINAKAENQVQFRLSYEPGITIGDIASSPKVQKYHTTREFYDLFKPFFKVVNVNEAVNNVQAVCARPEPVDPARLLAALRFEFDLPYPDGSHMGLADAAIAAFSKRLGVTI